MLTRPARKRLDRRVAILAPQKTLMLMDSQSRKLDRNALQSKWKRFQYISGSRLKLKRWLKLLKMLDSRQVPMPVTTRAIMLLMKRQTLMRTITRRRKRRSLWQPLPKRRARRQSKSRQPRLRTLRRKSSIVWSRLCQRPSSRAFVRLSLKNWAVKTCALPVFTPSSLIKPLMKIRSQILKNLQKRIMRMIKMKHRNHGKIMASTQNNLKERWPHWKRWVCKMEAN